MPYIAKRVTLVGRECETSCKREKN